MAAGVRIVCFDDVPEQHGGASIRVAELERVVEANLALARKVGQKSQQRQREDDEPRMGDTSERREDGDGRQRQVDGPDPDHEAHEAPR